jgi:predicted DNA-binding transcriptional regulator AlpA
MNWRNDVKATQKIAALKATTAATLANLPSDATSKSQRLARHVGRNRVVNAATATLANLPTDLGRNRILDTAASAAFWSVSLPHWRRMYRAGKVPQPIKIGTRKLGWRLGSLIDALEAREPTAA